MTNEKREEFKKKWSKEFYLGDGIYVSYDGHNIKLTTGEHSVWLNPEVLEAMKSYEESLRQSIRKLMKVGEYEPRGTE